MNCQILQGDAIEMLKTLPDESVQTCVTSPPYFGLRDYGVDGQIGLEETPSEFVGKLVEVFEQVKRVLKDDGTLWLNLGDSYAGSWGNYGGQNRGNGSQRDITNGSLVKDQAVRNGTHKPATANPVGYKQKDLMGIPWRVAFALQDAGWYLRQDIIWSKPNPMPESVRDRCTKAHEYIFLLSKSARYFFDADAIKEPIAPSSISRLSQDIESQLGSERVPGKTNGAMKAVRFGGNKYGDSEDVLHRTKSGGEWNPLKGRDRSLPNNRNGITGSLDTFEGVNRNKRSVWQVTTQPYREAHFATFPEKLIEPCILAGSKAGDLVLDPFTGSGTTAVVSLRFGRDFVGTELNPAYIEIANKRLEPILAQPSLI